MRTLFVWLMLLGTGFTGGRAAAQNAAVPLGICASASGSSTTYTCNPPPLRAYLKGESVSWTPDTTNSTTTPTLDLGPGPKNLMTVDGNPITANSLLANSIYLVAFDGVNIRIISGPNTYIAPGQITLIISGVCPFGFSEVVALNGKTVIGTLAANHDVGTTGGSDTIMPAGTVAPIAATATAGLKTPTAAVQNVASEAHTHPAPAFSGIPFDNRSAFVKVIFCAKN